ncbi:beta-galactosidase [Vibrio astriarenae]|nr:beta-galactosidase [Vibrio sp. C7]
MAFSEIIQRRDWENPQSVNLHCMKAHSPLASFRSAKDARENNNSHRRSLNGDWKFKLFDAPEQVDEDFIKAGFNDSPWSSIPVPSNWQLQAMTSHLRQCKIPFRG